MGFGKDTAMVGAAAGPAGGAGAACAPATPARGKAGKAGAETTGCAAGAVTDGAVQA